MASEETNAYFPYLLGDDFKSNSSLFKSLIAEALGTLILVFVGCGSCLGGPSGDIVRIALAFGLTVFILASTIGHVSGCHVNPAVTFGLIFGRQIGFIKGVLFILAQCFGAIGGSALLYAFVDSTLRQSLGATTLNPSLNIGQGIGIEFVITFVLVLVVFATAVDNNNGPSKLPAPLPIGVSIAVCHLFAVPFTGSSMNPARSFGVALVTGIWSDHYIYWIGPILGGIAASIFYQLVLMAPSPSTSPLEQGRKTELEKLNQI